MRRTLNVIVAVVLAISVTIAQRDSPFNKIRKLDDQSKRNTREVYIHYNVPNKDSKHTYVYLINETDSIVNASGFFQQIEFDWEGLNGLGEWVRVYDHKKLVCGTGFDDFEIPPNHYASQRINLDEYKGNYKTTVRWSYPVGTNTIASETIELSIDSSYLFSLVDRLFLDIDTAIESADTPLSKKNEYRLLKISKYLSEKDLLKANNLLVEVLLSDSENWEAYYKACLLFGVYAANNFENLPESEVYKIINEIIIICEAIPKTYEKIDKVKQVQEVYSKYLDKKGIEVQSETACLNESS